jgi:hypothetical protein
MSLSSNRYQEAVENSNHFQVERYDFNLITRFFLFCSGADVQWLSRCSQREVTKYFGVGSLVFMTALFAFISSTYSFYSIFSIEHDYFGHRETFGKRVFSWSVLSYSMIFGFLWSLFIFFIDRFIVSTISKSDSTLKQIALSVPRLVIAIFIAITISQPLEVWIFHERIQGTIKFKADKMDSVITATETADRNAGNTLLAQSAKLKHNYQGERASDDPGVISRQKTLASAQQTWENDKASLEESQSTLRRQIGDATDEELPELERKLEDIKERMREGERYIRRLGKELDDAVTKWNNDYNTRVEMFTETEAADKTNLEAAERRHAEAEERANFASKTAFSDNILSQLDGLDSYLEGIDAKSDPNELKIREKMTIKYYVIMLLFLLFEIAPILSKLMMPRGEYDDIALAYNAVHHSKVTHDQNTAIVNHQLYLQDHRQDNLALFKDFIKDLNPSRKHHIKILIDQYHEGTITLTELFQEVREGVINDLPEQVGVNPPSRVARFFKPARVKEKEPDEAIAGEVTENEKPKVHHHVVTPEKEIATPKSDTQGKELIRGWAQAFKDHTKNIKKVLIPAAATSSVTLFLMIASNDPKTTTIGSCASILLTHFAQTLVKKLSSP